MRKNISKILKKDFKFSDGYVIIIKTAEICIKDDETL